MNRTLICIAVLAAPLSAAGQDIYFGDDTSPWANDGECDDPRFDGPGTADTLLDGDLLRDAADCRILFERGEVWLRGGAPLIVTGQDIDFGDDSGNYPDDGECDDPRFEGPGAYSNPLEEDAFRDASDCLALFDSGQVWLVGDGPESFGSLAIGEDLGYGGTVSAPTQAKADGDALSECGSVDSGCSIVARFGSDTCIAVARDDEAGSLGWATGPDSEETTGAAISECIAGGGSICTVGDFACNGASASMAESTERDGFSYAIPVGEAWQPPTDETCEVVSRRNQADYHYCWVETENQPGCWAYTERLLIYDEVGTVNWSGNCRGGMAHGPGTTDWEFSSRLGIYNITEQGTYTEGKREGEWSHHVLPTGSRLILLYRDGFLLERQSIVGGVR